MPLTICRNLKNESTPTLDVTQNQPAETIQLLISNFLAHNLRLPTQAEIEVMLQHRGWHLASSSYEQSDEELFFRGRRYIRYSQKHSS